MSVSRILPGRLARRFSSAPRAVCTLESASLEVVIAEGFMLRLRGLAGLDERDLVPLLFPRCRSLHTFGMRVPLDVVWLELGKAGEGEVVAVEAAMERRRTTRAPRGTGRSEAAALELRKGDADALGLESGVRLTIKG